MSKQDIAWHNLSLTKVFKTINSSTGGLTRFEVKKRLDKNGFNTLAKANRFSVAELFISQFRSALVYVLIIAGIISFIFGEYVDGYVIFAAVFINVIVGFIQEFKANKSLEKLNKIVKKEVLVLRDGVKKKIESRYLVPGDIIILSAGNRVPADARLIEINDFEVNEATLTGESWPVKKTLNELEVGKVLAERNNMVFMGTLAVEGRAQAVVVATGFETEMGKITVMLKETKEDKTPLQQKLDHFAKDITKVIIIIALFLVIFGMLRGGHSWVEMFTLAVAIAVSAIPEGLVISMTMILTVGMQRILRHKGLVRRLVSAETLGSTTVICTDKTGTLTEGEMRVTSIATNQFQFDLSTGSLRDLKASKELDLITQIAFFCNDSVVQNPEASGEDWVVLGSPTERALMIFGSNDSNIIEDQKKMKRIGEIPFDHQRKFMVTRHSYDSTHDIIFIKGAPERILEYSDQYLQDSKVVQLNKVKQEYFDEQWKNLSKSGLRVLAGAYKLIPKNYNIKDCKDNPHAFIFVGIWGLSDPLRKEAKQSLKETLKAGINTVIITGDNKFTARTIARDLGLSFDDDSIVTGDELLKMTDDELAKRVRDIKVYARVSPSDKLRIIKAWQNKGEVVSMTGDGVNDAPALKAADIGVAVSSGSDVAKETADLVLLDNNFQTIVRAIKEGRVIFANLKRVILYLVSDSFSGVILIVGSMLLRLPLPISAVQILWINLFSDSFPALALTLEPEDDGIMNNKPKRIKSVLDAESRLLIFIISFITGTSSLFLFWYYLTTTGDIVLARTVVFAALGLDTLLYVFSIRNLEVSLFRSKLFRNKYLNGSIILGFAIQLCGVYVPFFNKILNTEPLHLGNWFEIFIYIVFVMSTLELIKAMFNYYRKKNK